MPLSSVNNVENVWKGIHHLFCQFKDFNCMGVGKPRGILAGRKLKTKRRLQK